MNTINSFYPFQRPNEIEGMIIGNDIDSVLSSCLLHSIYGWNIVGVYDYSNLWFDKSSNVTLEKIYAGDYIAVDLDIYNKNIYSIGHHIISEDRYDYISNHQRSFNPNLQRNFSSKEFTRKYPLGTIHLIIMMVNHLRLSRDAMILSWIADSSFINGQSHRFRRNVLEWNENYFKGRFSSIVNEIDTLDFEYEVKNLVDTHFNDISICQSTGQVSSRHLGITGFQCQWNNPNTQNFNIQRLLDQVSKVTNWKRPYFPHEFSVKSGKRRKIMLSEVKSKYGNLDQFLENEKVFSYVLPFRDSINYTTDIGL